MGCAPDSGISVADCFEKVLSLLPWWNQHVGQPWGVKGEKGTDFDVPWNTPIGSITGGKVIYAGKPPDSLVPGQTSIGYVVQVETPDGQVVHYQHLQSKAVSTGQQIDVGTVVGNSGGCATGSSSGHCIADTTSTGPHIEVRVAPYDKNKHLWNFAWTNPVPYINKVTKGNVNGPASSNPVQSAFDAISGAIQGITSNIPSWGEEVGIFVLALVMIILGVYLVAEKQVNQVAATATKAVAA